LKRQIKYVIIGALGISSCRKPSDLGTVVQLDIPAHFDDYTIPSNNELTLEKIELGKLFFEDPSLSLDSSVSCMSCHQKSNAFGTNNAFDLGVNDKVGRRNSPPLFNLVYHPYLFRDGGSPTLEQMVVGPIEDSLEMNINIVDLSARLDENIRYNEKSTEIFGHGVTPKTITYSLASYLRTLISKNSPYDLYLGGNENALTEDEKAGMNLFNGKANCIACHNGSQISDFSFQNNGLYANYIDQGRARVTLNANDEGKFKVPSLRNIAYSWPYMHDGSLISLEDVIEHYNTGGQNHVNQSNEVYPLGLTDEEKEQLKLFLLTFSDPIFVE